MMDEAMLELVRGVLATKAKNREVAAIDLVERLLADHAADIVRLRGEWLQALSALAARCERAEAEVDALNARFARDRAVMSRLGEAFAAYLATPAAGAPPVS